MEDMIIVNPNADLPPSTLALPIGLQRNGRSSMPRATSATLTQPVMTTASHASALSRRDARPSGPPVWAKVKAGVSMLQEQALEFKSLDLPQCIAYLGPMLMKGKAFEDVELWANAAGTCGLAALIRAESTCAFANKINSICKAPLPPLHSACQEDIDELKSWREDVCQDVAAWKSQIKNASDMGAKMAAGIFNKETEAIRQLTAKSYDLSPINNILLNSPPTESLLFSDNKKIAKAMEAADRHRLYPPKSTFPRSSGPKSRGGGKVTLTSSHASTSTPYQKPKSVHSPEPKKSGNEKGRSFCHQKRSGRQGCK
jgi:hypothetical protein